ncbi:MAG: hypothetical protein EAY81_12245, partial [Bacteroidetes bacterium]
MLSKQPIKFVLVMLCFAMFTGLQAQDLNVSCLSYDWSEKPENFKPDSSDKTYASVTILLKKVNEYRYNEKTKYLEAFYASHTIKYLNDDKSVE